MGGKEREGSKVRGRRGKRGGVRVREGGGEREGRGRGIPVELADRTTFMM